MTVQSGPAASINAFAALPPASQMQQLQNDAHAAEQSFALARHEIDSETEDRKDQRKTRVELRKLELEHDQRKATKFMVGVAFSVVGIVGLSVVAFVQGHADIGLTLVTSAITGGGAYAGGRGQGLKEGQRENERKRLEAETERK